MESVFFDANPSMKQLTDTTQRMSDQMQRAQQKEMKKTRAAKSVPVDSTDISTESELMGEDMMGDMDPDQFRGRRPPSYQDMKERMSDGDGNAKEEGREKEDEENPLERGMDDGLQEPPGLSSSMPGQTSSSGDLHLPHEQHHPYGTAEKAGEKSEEKPDKNDGLKKKVSSKGAMVERVDINPLACRKKPEPAAPASVEPEEKPAAPKAPASPCSLLTWDEEFIIADPHKREAVHEEDREEHQEYEAIELPDEEDSGDQVINTIIDEMLLSEPEPELLASVRRLIAPLGRRILKICRDFGIRIAMPGERDLLVSFLPIALCAEPYTAMRCGYVPEKALCIVGNEFFLSPCEPLCVPRLYLAYAFDHALGRDQFASLKSAAVLSNYKLCLRRERGHQFMDSFSATSAVHYCARSIELYLSDEEGGSPGQREIFYDHDRSMYLYIEYLFKEINKEAPRPFKGGSGLSI